MLLRVHPVAQAHIVQGYFFAFKVHVVSTRLFCLFSLF